MRIHSRWVLLVLGLAVSVAAQAETRNVPSVAFPTIGSALTTASSGDTIKIGAGRFKENVTVVGPLDNITISGSKTIWDGNIAGTNGTQLIFSGLNLTISGIEFQHGGDSSGSPFEVINISGNGATVTKCVFRGCEGRALRINGTGATVSNCTFSGVTASGVVSIAGQGATLSGCGFFNCLGGVVINGDNATVVKNVMDSSSSDDGFDLTSNNALVSGNSLTGINGSGVIISGTDAVVTKNRFDGLGYDFEHGIFVDGDAVVSGNLIDGGFSYDGNAFGIQITGTGNVTKNRVANIASGPAVTVGIEADGDDSVVSGNTILNLTGTQGVTGIFTDGDRSVTSKNSVSVMACGADDDMIGIIADGDDAQVVSNKLSQFLQTGNANDSIGVYLSGNGGLIQSNSVQQLTGGANCIGIHADGNGHRVLKNTLQELGTNQNDTYGIELIGDDAVVDGNKVSRLTYAYGIFLQGDRFTITKNQFANLGNDTYGIEIDQNTHTSGNGGTVSKNSVRNCASIGYLLNISFTIMDGCSARNCGQNGDAAFEIDGDENTFTKCSVLNAADDGFRVAGDNNVFTSCSAKNCDKDGFDVEQIDVNGDGSLFVDSDSNVFEKCTASNCAAEGFDNGGGTATDATNCKFSGCRTDFAGDNDMNDFTGTSFTTGDETTAPEVD